MITEKTASEILHNLKMLEGVKYCRENISSFVNDKTDVANFEKCLENMISMYENALDELNYLAVQEAQG